MDYLLLYLSFAKGCLDDIIIASLDHAQYQQHLRQLFEVLRTAKLQPRKELLGERINKST